MPRSAKQIAFFKSVLTEAGLCGPCRDVFDYEGRLRRAVKVAKARLARRRAERGKKHSDAYARRHGFKDMAQMEDTNWRPHVTALAWRKKVNASRSKKKGKGKRPKKTQENPFAESGGTFYYRG